MAQNPKKEYNKDMRRNTSSCDETNESYGTNQTYKPCITSKETYIETDETSETDQH